MLKSERCSVLTQIPGGPRQATFISLRLFAICKTGLASFFLATLVSTANTDGLLCARALRKIGGTTQKALLTAGRTRARKDTGTAGARRDTRPARQRRRPARPRRGGFGAGPPRPPQPRGCHGGAAAAAAAASVAAGHLIPAAAASETKRGAARRVRPVSAARGSDAPPRPPFAARAPPPQIPLTPNTLAPNTLPWFSPRAPSILAHGPSTPPPPRPNELPCPQPGQQPQRPDPQPRTPRAREHRKGGYGAALSPRTPQRPPRPQPVRSGRPP